MHIQSKGSTGPFSVPAVLSFRRTVALSGRPRTVETQKTTEVLEPGPPNLRMIWEPARPRPEPCGGSPPPISALMPAVESLMRQPLHWVLTIVWPGVRLQLERTGPRAVLLRMANAQGANPQLMNKLRVELAQAGIRLVGTSG